METLRLGLEWFLNPDHVPLLIGQSKGWFRDAGLDVSWVEPDAHLDAFEAIEKGELDLAVTEPLHLVIDRAQGHNAVGFARFLHTNGGVMYLENKGIERPRDMAGKRVQYPGAPGPGGLAIVNTMIQADGGAVDDALVPVNNSFYHTDALLEEKADVATLVFYNFELIEAHHRGVDANFFALKDWGVPDFCQLILITSETLLEERRGALQRFLRVLHKGIDLIHQRPDEAREIYYTATKGDPDDAMGRAIFDATVPCFTFDFSMSLDYYTRLQDWLLSTRQIERGVDVAHCWTNALAF